MKLNCDLAEVHVVFSDSINFRRTPSNIQQLLDVHRRRREAPARSTNSYAPSSTRGSRAAARLQLRMARAIVHLDMDAFYAQVEARRLGLPASAPLGVVQWASLFSSICTDR